MISLSMEAVFDLMWDQYQEMTNRDDLWEMEYLHVAAEKGLDSFAEACHVMFGIRLSEALCCAIANASEQIKQIRDLASSDWMEEETDMEEILMAQDLAEAVQVLCKIQKKTAY